MIRATASAALLSVLACTALARAGGQLSTSAGADSLLASRIAVDRYTPAGVAERLYGQLQLVTTVWRTTSRDTVTCAGGRCLVLPLNVWRSLGSPGPGAGRLHIPPYLIELRQPVRHEYSILPEQARSGIVFERRVGWVPVSQAIGGRDSIARWIAAARTNELKECTADELCRAVRFAVPSGRAAVDEDATLDPALPRPRTVTVADTVVTGGGSLASPDTLHPDERRIASLFDTLIVDCRVPRVGSAAGVPRDCVHIATLAGGNQWVRVTIGTIGNGNVERVVARFDTVVHRPPAAHEKSGVVVDFDALRGAVASSLAARPLALQTTIRSQRVLGAGAYRTSDVIPKPPPWREIVDVDVEVDVDHQTNDVSFFVQIHADVNPQNTPDGYGRVSGAQSKAYEAAVSDALKRAVDSVCTRGYWRDAWTFRCLTAIR